MKLTSKVASVLSETYDRIGVSFPKWSQKLELKQNLSNAFLHRRKREGEHKTGSELDEL